MGSNNTHTFTLEDVPEDLSKQKIVELIEKSGVKVKEVTFLSPGFAKVNKEQLKGKSGQSTSNADEDSSDEFEETFLLSAGVAVIRIEPIEGLSFKGTMKKLCHQKNESFSEGNVKIKWSDISPVVSASDLVNNPSSTSQQGAGRGNGKGRTTPRTTPSNFSGGGRTCTNPSTGRGASPSGAKNASRGGRTCRNPPAGRGERPSGTRSQPVGSNKAAGCPEKTKVGSDVEQRNLNVVEGDIVLFSKADVLVNPVSCAATRLRHAGEVSRAFYDLGREKLQKEFEDAGPPQRFGTDVTITGPGEAIRCKMIFHPAIGEYRNENSLQLYTSMVKKCLKKAETHKMTSIAFPAAGCGQLGYDPSQVAHCFAEAAKETKLQIYIVAYPQELFKTLMKIFAAEEKSVDTPIEMPIVHPALTELTEEVKDKIRSLQSDKVRIKFAVSDSTVTLVGKRKFLNKVQQQVIELLNDYEKQRSKLGYIKQTKGVREYLIALSKKSDIVFPRYWTNSTFSDLDGTTSTTFPLDKTSPVYDAVQAFVQSSWIPSLVTVGRDARGLHHSNIFVTNIWTIENQQLYTNYVFKLKAFASTAANKPFSAIAGLGGEPDILTNLITGVDCLKKQLVSELNEVYLFHGSSHVEEIVKSGIDSRFCGDKVLFGKGAYFAESSTKSDQYTDPSGKTARGPHGQPLYMFVARVLLGEPCLPRDARPHLKKAPCSAQGCMSDSCTLAHPMCDSVLGTHRDPSTPLAFREFIVYHPDQSYPEFLVEYVRA